MSYINFDQSTASGRPAELYRFTVGVQKWLYTSSQSAISYQNESYSPISIRRSNIEQADEINRANLEILLPRDNALSTLFIASPPEGVVSITVYRVHLSDPALETIVLWKGRVGGARLSGSELMLQCEPISTSLKRTGLRARYSLICRHALYSSGCGALKDDFRVEGTIFSINGLSVQINEAASRPDGYFVAGMIVTNDGQRMIIGHSGVNLTLVAPAPFLAAGLAVRLFAGCDHATTTCKDRFDNLANYGGFPFVPTKNPFSGDAIV